MPGKFCGTLKRRAVTSVEASTTFLNVYLPLALRAMQRALFAWDFIARNRPDVRTLVRIAITRPEEFRFRVLLHCLSAGDPASFVSLDFSRMEQLFILSRLVQRYMCFFSKRIYLNINTYESGSALFHYHAYVGFN